MLLGLSFLVSIMGVIKWGDGWRADRNRCLSGSSLKLPK